MRLRPDLAALPLDNELVIFSEETQCLVGLNESAAFVFRGLQKGIPASELAQALASQRLVAPEEADYWVTITLDALASHGMTADGRPPKSLGTVDHDTYHTDRVASMPPYALVQPAAERRYRLLDTCALIRFAMLEQMERVDAVIGHLATDDKAEATVVVDIHAVRYDPRGPLRSYIYRDGEPLEFTTGLHRLAPAVKAALWQCAVNAHDFLFYIHAGVVGTGESCILLPATAGSGKSSLTTALTHKGYRYFSDEVALIEPRTFEVPPVPLAICVKRTGWDLIGRYHPEISGVPTHERSDGKVVRYIIPPSGAAQKASAPVSHIVFPRYEMNAQTELKAVARAEALGRLMGECLALRRRLDLTNVEEIVRWIAGIDCYALTFSSLDEATERVAQVVPRVNKH
jgi:hypothetical protein